MSLLTGYILKWFYNGSWWCTLVIPAFEIMPVKTAGSKVYNVCILSQGCVAKLCLKQSEAEAVVQTIECLPSVHKVLD